MNAFTLDAIFFLQADIRQRIRVRGLAAGFLIYARNP